ncbi:hypothetical protein [Bdellovibrio sp. NC01]|uniref:hypothetical protein n=1 Tax=Bdellovibrio sp. NC01 TaxID=2220073 RepID=UPI00115BD1C3|nr:hypothetical protein [Bdellovibrio sp. NC01]QDK37968.1 hypothetical protein DOE51_10395 [Bdellovibrio sp. NC01]
MPSKLNRVITCLKIIAGAEMFAAFAILACIIYMLAAVPVDQRSIGTLIFLSVIFMLVLLMIVAIYKVVSGLRHGLSGAWVGGVILLSLSLSSLLFPVAIVGLIAIFSKEVRSRYISNQHPQPELNFN